MLKTHIKIFLATSVKSITRFCSRGYHWITAQIWDTNPLEPDEHPSMEKPSRPSCPWVCADCDGTKKRWKWSLKIEYMCCNCLIPVSVETPCLSKSCKILIKPIMQTLIWNYRIYSTFSLCSSTDFWFHSLDCGGKEEGSLRGFPDLSKSRGW